jgi:hypothetical protein
VFVVDPQQLGEMVFKLVVELSSAYFWYDERQVYINFVVIFLECHQAVIHADFKVSQLSDDGNGRHTPDPNQWRVAFGISLFQEPKDSAGELAAEYHWLIDTVEWDAY